MSGFREITVGRPGYGEEMTPSSARGARRLEPLVIVAIIVTVLAWASAFVVIRGLGSSFGGGSLALMRLGVGTIALSFLLIGHRWVRPTGREWLFIVLSGLSWFGIYNVVLNLAEQSLDAGTTALIVGIGPLLIALGAGIFLGEGIPKWLAIGAGVAFLGVVLISSSAWIAGAALPEGGASMAVGIGLAVVAAITYAIGVLLQKPVIRRIPARQFTFLAAAVGAVACLPFAGSLVSDLGRASASAILGGVYLGIVPTALAFSTWGYALTRMPAGQLAVTTYIVPPLVIVIAFFAFGEVPALLAIVGGVIALSGVALSRRRTKSAAEKPVPAAAESLAE